MPRLMALISLNNFLVHGGASSSQSRVRPARAGNITAVQYPKAVVCCLRSTEGKGPRAITAGTVSSKKPPPEPRLAAGRGRGTTEWRCPRPRLSDAVPCALLCPDPPALLV